VARALGIIAVVFLFLLSAAVGIAWARQPTLKGSNGSPTGAGQSNRATPKPSPSAPPPCTSALLVSELIHQKLLVGNPRPYALATPAVPAPGLAFQFDLPQSYTTGPAIVLIYATVSDRVRAQSTFPPTDTVGGRGRLIWSLDSVAASDAAPYRLALDGMTGTDQPCGQPAG
jgi:hypothetical protein